MRNPDFDIVKQLIDFNRNETIQKCLALVDSCSHPSRFSYGYYNQTFMCLQQLKAMRIPVAGDLFQEHIVALTIPRKEYFSLVNNTFKMNVPALFQEDLPRYYASKQVRNEYVLMLSIPASITIMFELTNDKSGKESFLLDIFHALITIVQTSNIQDKLEMTKFYRDCCILIDEDEARKRDSFNHGSRIQIEWSQLNPSIK